MSNTYMGFKVKLESSQLGQVIGTVCSVTETKIELSNAILNDKGPRFPLISVESQFIQDIRILAVNEGVSSFDESSDDVAWTVGHEGKARGGRARRRELLRSMPNTCIAYVCPESPPLIHRTIGTPNFPGGGNSRRQPSHCLLQKLDSALATVKLADRLPRTKNHLHEERSVGKRRNLSTSETLLSSELSGTESDSMGISGHPYTIRGMTPEQQTNGYRQPLGRPRGHQRVGVTRQQQLAASSAKWEEVRVEDFIDEDFDFEKNLALFDKSAFYDMVDMKKCGNNPVNQVSSIANVSSSSATFDEGPDGVGVPLIGDVAHSIRVNPRCVSRDCTFTTNTPTESSSRKPHHPGYELDNPAPTSRASEKDNIHRSAAVCKTSGRAIADTNLSSFTNTNSVDQVKLSSQDWYSCTDQRIPVLTTGDRNRLLHYLATGADPFDHHASHSSQGAVAGLTWGRLLETAARSLTDHLMALTSQSLRQTPQRLASTPPIRVLLVPGGAHLSGALTLALARLLANRGACTILLAPNNSIPTNEDSSVDSQPMIDVYHDELNLLLRLAPRLNQYGLEDDDDGHLVGSSGDDILDDDEETDTEGNNSNGYNDAIDTAAEGLEDEDELDILLRTKWLQCHSGGRLSNRSDSEMTSRRTVDQNTSGGSTVVDYSPINRMWISRIPGLKILKRMSSLSKLSTDVCVNLVIVAGEVTTTNSVVRHHLNNWLHRHQAISRLVYLLPTSGKAEEIVFNRPSCTPSVVELGLPTLSPHEVASRFTPPITNRWLVDVGLTRKIVRRLTGDLKSLPPFGLFNTGSVVQLHWNRPTQDQSPAPSRSS